MKSVIPTGMAIFPVLLLAAVTGCELTAGDEKDEQLKPEAQHLVGTWTATGDSGVAYGLIIHSDGEFTFQKTKNGVEIYGITGTWKYREDAVGGYVSMSWTEDNSLRSKAQILEPYSTTWRWEDPHTNEEIELVKMETSS